MGGYSTDINPLPQSSDTYSQIMGSLFQNQTANAIQPTNTPTTAMPSVFNNSNTNQFQGMANTGVTNAGNMGVADYLNKNMPKQGFDWGKGINTFAKGATALSSLGSLYLGFKNYGLAKKQLGLAREQWQTTKDEMNRIAGVRKRISDKYMGRG